MRIKPIVSQAIMNVLLRQRTLLRDRDEDPERGDVPGWVFVTMMSAALAGVLYLVAAEQLATILSAALAAVAFGTP